MQRLAERSLFYMEQAKFYTKLFDMRQKGDYEDIIEYDNETVLQLIDLTKLFILQIENTIKGDNIDSID